MCPPLLRLVCFLLCLCLPGAGHPAPAATAALIDIDGAIGPATSLYYDYASHEAIARGDALIILRLDTPGGLDGPMRDIIKRILASPVPVVAYVAPSGARAASAGTYILYACHVAAMAPATNLGAATPIPVLGREPEAPPDAGDEAKGKAGTKSKAQPQREPADASERKAVNDATAYLRSLAEQRGRNADWAEQAVREGQSLSASAALKLKVADLIATSPENLLAQLDGRRIPWGEGSRVLHTQGMVIRSIAPTWRQQLLGVLSNPSVAYLLLLVGIYGLLLEGFSPGAILPGVTGGICLLLALYGFQLLPINYAGLALVALGIALIVAETVVTSAGVLGIGGVISFVAGSVMLFDSDVPGFSIPLGLIGGVAAAAALLMLLSLGLLWRNSRQPPLQSEGGLAGRIAVALEDFAAEGWVEVRGERWRARSLTPVRRGERLRIVQMHNLLLVVEPEFRST